MSREKMDWEQLPPMLGQEVTLSVLLNSNFPSAAQFLSRAVELGFSSTDPKILSHYQKLHNLETRQLSKIVLPLRPA